MEKGNSGFQERCEWRERRGGVVQRVTEADVEEVSVERAAGQSALARGQHPGRPAVAYWY